MVARNRTHTAQQDSALRSSFPDFNLKLTRLPSLAVVSSGPSPMHRIAFAQGADSRYGKGLWAKIPADGTTVVTKPTLMSQDEAGKNIWQDVKNQVPNRDLKAMVESYKTREPQAKEGQHRASARDELNALVKDTAAKVAADKPKAKTKSKKGPEL